jgi:hypothetical protein
MSAFDLASGTTLAVRVTNSDELAQANDVSTAATRTFVLVLLIIGASVAT